MVNTWRFTLVAMTAVATGLRVFLTLKPENWYLMQSKKI